MKKEEPHTMQTLTLNNTILDLLQSYRDGVLHTWGKQQPSGSELDTINSEIGKLEKIDELYQSKIKELHDLAKARYQAKAK